MKMDKHTRYAYYMNIVGPTAARNTELGIKFMSWLDSGKEKSVQEIEEFITRLR